MAENKNKNKSVIITAVITGAIAIGVFLVTIMSYNSGG